LSGIFNFPCGIFLIPPGIFNFPHGIFLIPPRIFNFSYGGNGDRQKKCFARLLSEGEKEDLEVDKDNVLNLFYSQFGKPQIVEVRFECLDSCKGKQSSSL
jgi:hypothetical protein